MHAYVTARGGLGDLIWWYCNHPEWRKVECIKKAKPEAKIDVILLTCNSNAASLLARNPYFNEIRTYQTEVDGTPSQEASLHAGEALPLREVFKLTDYLSYPIEFHLDKDEQEKARAIKARGPYCVLHPFAGDRDRNIYGRDDEGAIDLASLAMKIIEKGFNVVVVGGDSIRQENCRAWLIKEEFPMDHPQLFNLVNRYTPRLATYLTWHADRFVGSFSCYNVAAIYGRVKGVCYCHPRWKHYFETMDAYFRDIKKSAIKLLYYDKSVTPQTITNLL